jgi:hypothetical protein
MEVAIEDSVLGLRSHDFNSRIKVIFLINTLLPLFIIKVIILALPFILSLAIKGFIISFLL